MIVDVILGIILTALLLFGALLTFLSVGKPSRIIKRSTAIRVAAVNLFWLVGLWLIILL